MQSTFAFNSFIVNKLVLIEFAARELRSMLAIFDFFPQLAADGDFFVDYFLFNQTTKPYKNEIGDGPINQ